MGRVNLIDFDVRRRARVSRDLRDCGVHVEIYEDVEEFVQSGMKDGTLFIAEELDGGLAMIVALVRERAGTMLPIIGYAQDPIPEEIVSAMRAGAIDYLQWPFDLKLLRRAFSRAARGELKSAQELVRAQARKKVRQLTPRETEVLSLLVKGHSNKEIARELGISPRTVEIHRANMIDKLGAQSSSDAVRIGIYAGFDEFQMLFEVRDVA